MMDKFAYVEMIGQLGCKSAAAAGRLLGVTPRQSQYYAKGVTPVPEPIEYLILAMLELRMLRTALADAWDMIRRREAAWDPTPINEWERLF